MPGVLYARKLRPTYAHVVLEAKDNGLAIRPDAQRAAYRAVGDNNRFMLLDGKPGPADDNLLFLKLDSPTVLRALAIRERAIYRVGLTITPNP